MKPITRPKVRLVRGGYNDIDQDVSSVEMFKKMKLDLDSRASIAIMNDMALVIVKKAFKEFEYVEDSNDIFTTINVANTVTNYIYAFIDNRETSVIYLMYTVLIDIYTDKNNKQVRLPIIDTIYNDVRLMLIPN